MNHLSIKPILVAFTGAVLVLTAVLTLQSPKSAEGAQAGITASMATSSTIQVGPQNNVTLFDGSTGGCSSRVISTVGQPIMLSLGAMSSTTLSQTIGHQQAASTTAVYDSTLTGCGLVTARGLNASTTITITEYR